MARRSPPLLLPILALASALAASTDTSACTCANIPTFVEAFERSDAVFLGEVLAIESATPDYYPRAVWVVFRVDASWKGSPPVTTRLLTAADGGTCGVTFVPGTRYLVYAFKGVDGWGASPDPDALTTGLCWRTHAYWSADPDLVALGRVRVVELRAAFPSPSSGAVTFEYSLAADGPADLAIYDLTGRRVHALFARDVQLAGPHQRVWDGRDRTGRAVGAGVYVAVLTVDGRRLERRFALLR